MSDVTVHPADGLHVRVRSSKTDQEGHGIVRALPYGRDPRTCPPCALVRWRQLLLAYDDGGRPAAIAQLNRRGLATEHCCRGVDDTNTANADGEGADADQRESSVAGGRGGERLAVPDGAQDRRPRKVMTGDAVAMMINAAPPPPDSYRQRSARVDGPQVDLLVGIRCGPGSSPKLSAPAPTPTRSCGRPATKIRRCSRCTPGNSRPWSVTRF